MSEKQKTHNENNHVQGSEKRNATSLIIIQINSDSLENHKKNYIYDFCSFRCLRKIKSRIIIKIIMFRCQKNEMQLVWSSSTSIQTLWRNRKESRSCDFCSFRCLRKIILRLIIKIIMFKWQKNEMQLVWSSSTSNQTLWRMKKNSRSCDFCSFMCLQLQN